MQVIITSVIKIAVMALYQVREFDSPDNGSPIGGVGVWHVVGHVGVGVGVEGRKQITPIHSPLMHCSTCFCPIVLNTPSLHATVRTQNHISYKELSPLAQRYAQNSRNKENLYSSAH